MGSTTSDLETVNTEHMMKRTVKMCGRMQTHLRDCKIVMVGWY